MQLYYIRFGTLLVKGAKACVSDQPPRQRQSVEIGSANWTQASSRRKPEKKKKKKLEGPEEESFEQMLQP
jgi:hypothetical protein